MCEYVDQLDDHGGWYDEVRVWGKTKVGPQMAYYWKVRNDLPSLLGHLSGITLVIKVGAIGQIETCDLA
jgi:hypothetical protein